jgi:hypothetical protein
MDVVSFAPQLLYPQGKIPHSIGGPGWAEPVWTLWRLEEPLAPVGNY